MKHFFRRAFFSGNAPRIEEHGEEDVDPACLACEQLLAELEEDKQASQAKAAGQHI